MRAGTLSAAPLLAYVASLGDLGALADSDAKVLERARENGYLSVVAADQFACDVLGLHPCLIWPEWFSLGPFAEDTFARVVIEDTIGRFVRKDEKVIALDGNLDNLDPRNLNVVSKRKEKYTRPGQRRLTDAQVAEIRAVPAINRAASQHGGGSVIAQLAEKYGVSQSLVKKIRLDPKSKNGKGFYRDAGKRVQQEEVAA